MYEDFYFKKCNEESTINCIGQGIERYGHCDGCQASSYRNCIFSLNYKQVVMICIGISMKISSL